MTRIFSFTQPLDVDIVDVFCLLQKGFTDQFVYYRKDRPVRFMGLGRCIALPTLDDAECELSGPAGEQPVFFSFNRFDAHNPALPTSCSSRFPACTSCFPKWCLSKTSAERFCRSTRLGRYTLAVWSASRAWRFPRARARAAASTTR
ncbi:MAG: hypothetical protein V8T51_07460 [Senegalimassilia faecalis]